MGTDRNHNQYRFNRLAHDTSRSAMAKYKGLMVGDNPWTKLVRFELITGLFGGLPGALGLYLRQKFYPSLFKKAGRHVVFGRHLALRWPQRITLGDDVLIDEYAMLSIFGRGDEHIHIGDGVLIGRRSVVKCRLGSLQIGDHTNVGMDCRIASTSTVIIGEYCLFAGKCYIGGAQHRYDRRDIPITLQPLNSRGVVIEDDVWLGANVCVNDGVKIGKGAVVGAGAVVTKDIPPYTVAAGVPARVIKERP